MLDVEHSRRRFSDGGAQKSVVLQQPLQPLPLARKVAYVELLINGGCSVGLVSSPKPGQDQHIGWNSGSIGYHGDEGSIYVSSLFSDYNFGPTFGLDPALVVENDAGHAPRKADCIGVGIDYAEGDAGEGCEFPLLFFTKNGELVGCMRLPSLAMQYLAFALHSSQDRASLNVGTIRFYFDVETPPPGFCAVVTGDMIRVVASRAGICDGSRVIVSIRIMGTAWLVA